MIREALKRNDVIFVDYPVRPKELSSSKIIVEVADDEPTRNEVVIDGWSRCKDIAGDFIDDVPYSVFRNIINERLRRWGNIVRVFIPFHTADFNKFDSIVRLIEMAEDVRELNERELQDVFKKRFNGMKLGKYLRKQLLSGIKYDKNLIKIVDAKLPQLLDFTSDGWLVWSNAPIDILFPNFGSFNSCFSRDGEYVSSILGYLKSYNYHIVYFTNAEKVSVHNAYRRKWRIFTALDTEKEIMLGVKPYPFLDLTEYEVAFEKIYKLFFGSEPVILIPDKDDNWYDYCNKISGQQVRSSDAVYFDGYHYILYNPNKVFGLGGVIEYAEESYVFEIAYPFCLSCGEEIDCGKFLVCVDCGGYEDEDGFYCYYCEEYLYGEPYAWTHNGNTLCENCYSNHHFTCERCNEIYHVDNGIYIEDTGEIFCVDCARILQEEEEIFECDECCGWYDKHSINRIIFNGSLICVCDNCYEDYVETYRAHVVCPGCGIDIIENDDRITVLRCRNCGIEISLNSELEMEVSNG